MLKKFSGELESHLADLENTIRALKITLLKRKKSWITFF